MNATGRAISLERTTLVTSRPARGRRAVAESFGLARGAGLAVALAASVFVAARALERGAEGERAFREAQRLAETQSPSPALLVFGIGAIAAVALLAGLTAWRAHRADAD
jgi:hypothetical protein